MKEEEDDDDDDDDVNDIKSNPQQQRQQQTKQRRKQRDESERLVERIVGLGARLRSDRLVTMIISVATKIMRTIMMILLTQSNDDKSDCSCLKSDPPCFEKSTHCHRHHHYQTSSTSRFDQIFFMSRGNSSYFGAATTAATETTGRSWCESSMNLSQRKGSAAKTRAIYGQTVAC